MILRLVMVVAVVLGLLAPAASAEPPDNGFAPECDPAGSALVHGVVGCVRMPSAMLGATTAFSYYIPPACAGRECPVLYYLHGTGGSYKEGTGGKDTAGNAWVRALSSGPPEDPRSVDDPWRFSDLSTWVAQDPLDMIIVSPHGLTLPGGYGPSAHQNPFWFDWNPRYAKGGDTPRYDTPPPRFESHLTDELVPYVDANFPTSGDREQRAIVGYSMGGIGAMAVGLKHPDTWSSIGMRSGGTGPFPTADWAPGTTMPAGVAPPTDVPYLRLPGLIAGSAPTAVWDQLYGTVATVGFGDAVADHVWWRQAMGSEHVANARAWKGDRQSTHIKYFVNDAVPRHPEEAANHMQVVFEALLNPMSRYLDAVFEAHGVERTFDVGPGTHSGTYGVPYFREQLAEQYAHLRHADGGGDPGPRPDRFDYRTVRDDFEIWGWSFVVDREPVEYLNLTNVSCQSVTLRGTGTVLVTVPPGCRTGRDGAGTFTVDLGPSQATDEPGGAGSTAAYGRTVTVALESL